MGGVMWWYWYWYHLEWSTYGVWIPSISSNLEQIFSKKAVPRYRIQDAYPLLIYNTAQLTM